MSGPVLVTDFDGTMTGRDFYRLVIEAPLPEGTPDFWGLYLEGSITHFEALRRTFAAAREDEPALYALVDRMELDPAWADECRRLESAGWSVVVASAGCRWYIERLLGAEAGLSTIHANPGRLEAGRLVMERDAGGPFYCPDAGVDKAAIVRSYLAQGRVVAYAGDGLTDLPPARLVGAGLRFARGSLAQRLEAAGLAFQPFERFADVTRTLLPPT